AAAGLARLGDGRQAWQLARMLDPAARADGPPYLMSGGLRTIAPHAGRAIGGCTTPAAAWTWLLLVESLLGLERREDRLHLRPCLAQGWEGAGLRYRYRSAVYEIAVVVTDGPEVMLLDGQPCPDWSI
ncbi:hypothetical protein FPK46_22020, partial [Acinetobacter baumannii]|nr:hypothetical protein [Acinetobacter baumannii]